MWKKDWIKVEASDLYFNKYTQVHLLWSSTKVRKYLDPFKEGVEYGPQMSTWTKSKQDKEMLEEWVKCKLCYLGKGQMWQSKGLVLLQDLISGTILFNKVNLCEDGWPNL